MIALAQGIGAFAAMGVGGGGGFFAVKWFVEWMSGRMDKREARIDGGTDKLIEALERRVEALTARLDQVETDLADCKRKHAESDAEVLRLKAIIDGKGEIAQRAQAIVAADRAEVRQIKRGEK